MLWIALEQILLMGNWNTEYAYTYIHTINKWKVLYKGNQNATRHTIMTSYSFKYYMYQRVFSPEFLPTNNYKHIWETGKFTFE